MPIMCGWSVFLLLPLFLIVAPSATAKNIKMDFLVIGRGDQEEITG
jgi:hypothetical protein